MGIAVLGIDLGKTSCSVVGLDGFGQVMLRWRMRRETVVAYAAKLRACIVAMEAWLAAPTTWAGHWPPRATRCG
jgi:predicted NBD/HSP70 family sugar kinase